MPILSAESLPILLWLESTRPAPSRLGSGAGLDRAPRVPDQAWAEPIPRLEALRDAVSHRPVDATTEPTA